MITEIKLNSYIIAYFCPKHIILLIFFQTCVILVHMQTLNTGQQVAVQHLSGPMMVLAGPGSGKTTVITHRTKYLIEQGIDPSQILVITFSKAAATHMQSRYEQLYHAPGVTFSTFHALFFRILKAHTGCNLDNLIADGETEKLIQHFLKELGAESDTDTVSSVLLEMSLVNNDMLDIAHYNSMAVQTDDFRQAVAMYRDYKRTHDKIDFDDMLTQCYELLVDHPEVLRIWQNKYRYIMIDEFQDISKIQYSMVRLLCEQHNNLYIVGDDDQSIYAFRGARPNFLLNFEQDFAGVQRAMLDINYRSTDPIIKLSNAVIKPNTLRYAKDIKGTDKQGRAPIFVKVNNSDVEANYIVKKITELTEQGVALSDMCIIYRTNIQSRAVVDALSMANIPYLLKDQAPSIYDHFIVKDILAYLRLALNAQDNPSFVRIANKPKRYLSKGILNTLSSEDYLLKALIFTELLQHWQKRPVEELRDHLDILRELKPHRAIRYIRKTINYDSYIKEYAQFKKTNPSGMVEILAEITEAAKNFDTISDYLAYVDDLTHTLRERGKANKYNPRQANFAGVHLSTMHGVKGLEYHAVFVISCVETMIPHEKSQTPEQIEEERRLFYVAVTRAKELLYLSVIENRHEQSVKPTRFLQGIVNASKPPTQKNPIKSILAR